MKLTKSVNLFLLSVGLLHGSCSDKEANYINQYFSTSSSDKFVLFKDSCLYYFKNNELENIKQTDKNEFGNEIVKFDGTSVIKMNKENYLGDLHFVTFPSCVVRSNNNNNNNW